MIAARRRLPALLCCVLSVAACDTKPPAEKPARDPVVVYAYGDEASGLATWFDAFAEGSGIAVTLRHGDSASLTDEVIANRGSPPADVLLTSNVADIFRAAEEGALRPLQGDALRAVPAVLRDPDALWAAVDVRYAVIAASGRGADASVESYRSLAGSELRGRLCLSSARLPVNRAMIAMLIEDLGTRPAESLVRGWVRNLALPPFESERDLVAALRAGTCAYGIVSSSLLDDSLSRIDPVPLYLDIDAVGVTRHARHPDSAQLLVDWMLGQKGLKQPVSSNERNIGRAGWRDADAVLLAERAGYR